MISTISTAAATWRKMSELEAIGGQYKAEGILEFQFLFVIFNFGENGKTGFWTSEVDLNRGGYLPCESTEK